VLAYLCHPFYLTEGEIEGFASQLRTKSKHKTTLSISPSLLMLWASKQEIEGYANACL
jgi:hypothetical protein